MPAYMMISAKIHDRDRFKDGYGAAAAKLVHEYGGEYIVLAPGAKLLEGTLEGYTSVAISKWPDAATAMRFWDSDAYAEVKKLREGIAKVQVQLVEVP